TLQWISLPSQVTVVEPNLTSVAPVRLVPAIVTKVPPAVEPSFGLTAVTVGGEAAVSQVKWSAVDVAEVAAEVVTVTSTVPEVQAAGLVMPVILVPPASTLIVPPAASVPKWTAVAPVSSVPVIVTAVPGGPWLGLTPVTVGGVAPAAVTVSSFGFAAK